MKRFSVVLISACLLLPIAGCKTASSPTPPLAPGYQNTADQTIGETLAAAHAFYAQIQADAASGKYPPSDTEKAALNAFGVTLNTAQIAYLAYHTGTGTEAAAQAAATQVQTQQTALQSSITGGK